MIHIVAVADLHGNLPEIPECNILLIAGDICPTENHSIAYQRKWLDTEFRAWLEKIPAKLVYSCAGNHDFFFQHIEKHDHPRNLRWIYLQDETVNCWEFDLKIYGSPWQLNFGNWAFNAPAIDGEGFLARKYKEIPDDTNIIISHGPPRGYGDFLPNRPNHPAENVGSYSLLERIKEVRPQLCVFGHIHAGRGIYPLRHTYEQSPDQDKFSILCNASVVDEHYRMVHPPREFKINFD